MRRRELIAAISATGACAAVLCVALAQQGTGIRRVAVLGGHYAETTSLPIFRNELAKLGWIEGRNLRIDFRSSSDDAQTRVVAADLVQLAPDVIVPTYLAALRAVQQQTKTVPIVLITTGDPVESGTVRNPAHPEGNVTGVR
jgi:putative tryptophan/tyrosine transport system substrate-binding protein